MTLPLMWPPCRVCDRVAVASQNRVFSMTLCSQRQTLAKQDFYFFIFFLKHCSILVQKTSPNGLLKCVQACSQVETTCTNEFCGVVNLHSAAVCIFAAESLKRPLLFFFFVTFQTSRPPISYIPSITVTNMKQRVLFIWTECKVVTVICGC